MVVKTRLVIYMRIKTDDPELDCHWCEIELTRLHELENEYWRGEESLLSACIDTIIPLDDERSVIALEVAS